MFDNIKWEIILVSCNKYSEINFKIYSSKDTTIVFCGTGSIFAPGEVNPGHIMLAPLITNLMAPKSTCSLGRKNGSKNKKY